MPTNKEIDAFTHEQRSAWLDSMTEDEREICYSPPGFRYTLIIASFLKYMLTRISMTTEERVKHLERLNGLVDDSVVGLTEEGLAAIQVPCDTSIEIISAAMDVDRSDKPPFRESFKLLTSWEVFNHLVALNPSLLAAIKLRRYRSSAAAPAIPH